MEALALYLLKSAKVKPATDKYGEKAKGGVIKITTKKNVVDPVN